MSSAEMEHLESVARRNAYIYKGDKVRFERHMRRLGWSEEEISLMERYIEKEERKTQEK